MPGMRRFESRFGIASRLALAFGSVAVLAVAANLIAEHGAAIVYRTEVRDVRESRPPASPSPQAVSAVHERSAADALRVAAAVYAFDAATRMRAEQDGSASRSGADDAAAALERETTAYVAAAGGSLDRARLATLRSALGSHRADADELLAASAERRRLIVRYRVTFDALDARVKESIDRAWKIFGRIVARESLVELSRQLDRMRLDLPAATASTIPQAAIDGEEALPELVSGKSLARSQGEEWLAAARADVTALGSLRADIERAEDVRAAALARFDESGRSLDALLRSFAERSQRAATLARSVAEQSVAHGPAARRHPARAVEKVVRSSDGDDRALIAWLSGGVLLLLLVVSAATVVSIVRPVRRLMDATRRIAAGDGAARVPRGGIRELDALAVSFNEMAERLTAAQAVARQYHGQLEAKVEERTRALQHLAAHDPLTQLPNRRELFGQLDAAIGRAKVAGSVVGVFFIDLDNFKNINDSMGHVFGDRVLQTFSQRLQGACPSSGWPARLGGDEFTVVLEDARGLDDVVEAGRALVRAFRDDPLVVDGRELSISISVGASAYPEHDTDAESLLRAADAALFHAKALGRSRMSLFSPELLVVAESKFTTEQGLRRAMERNELELVFQPEVNADTGRVDLLEALLRWRLPSGQLMSPQDFLPVAEECGLVGPMGKWVMKTAMEQAARWHRSGWSDVRVAINVSSRQLLDPRFVESARQLLDALDLPARCIEFELTENVLQTAPSTVETLRQLRQAGFGVALDDFGTGYSSLVSLEQLPLTRVKLDRSLIAGIDGNARSLSIARAIIGLCEGLGLEITAEGIERREQLAPLLGAKGLSIQGYLLAKPLPAGEILAARSAMPATWRALRGAAGPRRLTSVA